MAGPLPVKGTEISSAPCSIKKAAGLLRRFLSSEAASEVGIARGYVEAVAQSLEEMLSRRKNNSGNGTESLKLTSGARISKFFNVEEVQKIPEFQLKSCKEKKLKQKKRDKAMIDFEALLGHELDGAEIGEQAGGGLNFEEKPAITEIFPTRKVVSLDDGRETPKSEKRKKKKRNSLDGDMDGMHSVRKAEAVVDNDPSATKSAKKEKKRKSLDGAVV